MEQDELTAAELTLAAGPHDTTKNESSELIPMQQESFRQRKKLNVVQQYPEIRSRKKWDTQSSRWGEPGSPLYPSPKQLHREVASLHLEHHIVLAEHQADHADRIAAADEEHRRLASELNPDKSQSLSESHGSSGGFGSLASKTSMQSYMSWAREQTPKQSQTSMERRYTRDSTSSSTSTRERKKKYEPAKVVGPDGKVRLRGVKSTSDISRYCKDVDQYSRKNWAIREAFKTMRSQEHARTSEATWGALRSWYSTDKPLNEWYASATHGRSSS
eukprot:TRINITY_DN107449_c0_g1_i1.p1 TRINITY_DN107449_c0_g1~~TRINITY_DN107449_c0_g1_i1.p1  ORF type:complete len:274 (-),score=42.19 TRINITY_DN107449_c0_g1_i1:45-866(-)